VICKQTWESKMDFIILQPFMANEVQTKSEKVKGKIEN